MRHDSKNIASVKSRQSVEFLSFLTIMFLFPVLVSAQRTLSTLVDTMINVLRQATIPIFGLALLAFFWGVAKFIFNAGSQQAAATGKKFMVYGAITLFVMVSIWGILSVIKNTFFP